MRRCRNNCLSICSTGYSRDISGRMGVWIAGRFFQSKA